MPAANPSDVLSKQMLTNINGGLAKIDSAVKACDLAEGCGVDCSAERDELEQAREFLGKVKSTYHPGAK